MNFLRHYLLALQFFTRIPVTGAVARYADFSPRRLHASTAHFPGIGLVVGGVSALVLWALARALPATAATPVAAAALSTAAGVLCTGALHEDALADVADGIGGSAQRERALEIMKDSRVGSFGAVAVVLALLAKVSLLAVLASVAPWRASVALVCAHVASRAAPLVLIRALPYVSDPAGSKSKALADNIGPAALLVGALWYAATLGIAARWLAPGALVAGCLLCLLVLLALWGLFARRLQGITGDCLGATQQLCEIAFYLGVTLCA